VKGAMAQAILHWGPSAWAIYAIVGLTVAYVSFRKGRVPLMSSVLAPLWGGHSKDPGSRIIDSLAILATLFGTAAALGIGALQIGRGVTIVSGWSPEGNALALGIIVGLAFIMLGGTAIWFQHNTGQLVAANDPANLPAPEAAFFEVLDLMPGANWIIPVVLVMLAIFFITSSDSASLVNSQFSQQGNPNPRRGITALWAVLMAGIAAVMLLTGGRSGLQGMQNMVIISAFPFALVLIAMAVALMRELRLDPMMIRAEYEQAAVANAVRHGIAEHGDNFELSIDPVEPDNERAVGHHFDSTAEEVTEWYARTDEDGNPIEFDYETGQYLDDDGNPLEPERTE